MATASDLHQALNQAVAKARAALADEPMVVSVSIKAVKSCPPDGKASLLYEAEVEFGDETAWWSLEAR